jgi:polysaccharide export outer membrane protein
MKLIKSFFIVFLCFFGGYTNAESLSDYRVSSGDLIQIQVFGEDALSIETRLSDAGTISFPFLGELKIQDMTTGEVTDMLTAKLKDGYLLDPSVNVTVKEYREFYIHGQVEKPGAYPYQPGLTVQKAAALAGGFTERASTSKMFITRDGQTTPPLKTQLGAVVQPGDIIMIEESFF